MLNEAKKSRTFDYFGACTFYLGAIIVTLVCQALAGLVSAALMRSNPNISSDGIFNTAFMIVIQLANLALIVGFPKLNKYDFDFGFFKRKDTGRGVTAASVIVPVVAAGALLVGMYLPTVWYGYFTRYALGVPPSAGEINLDSAASVVFIVAASVFLAPICEETIYRGVLYNGMKKRGVKNAVLLSALAFTLMHMSVVQVVFQFAVGAASAVIMHRTKRLYPSVLFHATANSLALVMELTPLSGVLIGCEAWLTRNIAAALFITLGLLAASGGALYCLFRFCLNEKTEDASTEEQGAAETAETAEDGEQRGEKSARRGSDNGNGSDGAENAARLEQVRAAEREKDGTIRYCIGIGICVLMFILNFVTVITS